MNKRIFALLLAALFLLCLPGCAKKEYSEGKPKADLLATTQPVYQLTCALTDGTGLSVGLLISESVSCLHDYTLTVSQMEMIEQSGLVLESGLGLENFMEDVLRGKTRIDISRNLDTLPGEDGADPHWWLDPMRYKQAAELAAQELGAQYPEFSDQISENLAAFCEKLSSLQDYGEQALSNLSCRQLVTFHDGFSYFADAFSLTIAAAPFAACPSGCTGWLRAASYRAAAGPCAAGWKPSAVFHPGRGAASLLTIRPCAPEHRSGAHGLCHHLGKAEHLRQI